MALSIEEQEVCINAARDEKYATAYCSDRTWITRFDKLVEKSPDLFEVIAKTSFGKTYRFPKRLISIRSSIREMSEEQKEAAAERMRQIHLKNTNGN